MQTATKPFLRPILHSVGSLWFGAVLLIVVLLAMACGTIFESQQGTEQALWVFYRAWWFKALLGLLALNILASILVRYPFSLAKAGFLLTHGSILLLLGGAVITQFWGIDGQLGFAEGETISTFAVGENVVEITNTRTGEKKSIDLRSALGSGFSSVDDIDA